MNKKLVVIGNGFDLNLGLKSSYGDFFNWIDDYKKYTNDEINLVLSNYIIYLKSLENNNKFEYNQENIIPYLKENHNLNKNDNFWIIYFKALEKLDKLNRNDGDWKDIERNIEDLIINNINIELFNESMDSEGRILYYSILNLLNVKKYKSVLVFQIISLFRGLYEINNDNVYSFLYDQLKKFEIIFDEYLCNQMENMCVHGLHIRKYSARANILMYNIITGKNDFQKFVTPDTFDRLKIKYNLINFNYTSFYNSNDKRKINVHSTLRNHPIFGISSEIVDRNNPIFKFTKSFRTGNISSNLEKIITGRINSIVIYGHSLSKIDHSYFKLIFDHVNLYGSNIDLVFKYNSILNEHDLEGKQNVNKLILDDESKQLISIKEKAIKLLNDYESNLCGNEDLISKLKKENRLHFDTTISNLELMNLIEFNSLKL